jgi:hypothetical protein
MSIQKSTPLRNAARRPVREGADSDSSIVSPVSFAYRRFMILFFEPEKASHVPVVSR